MLEDMFRELFKCYWGSIPLYASSIHTDNSRTQVVHDLASGDLHPMQDRGMRARRVRVKLLFDDFPGEGTPMQLFERFKAAVDSGLSALFMHPIDGSYLASVGEFTYEIDANSVITDASAEFIAQNEIVAVSPVSAVTGIGDGAVAPKADSLDTEAAKVGLNLTSPALDKEQLSPLARARQLAHQRLGVSFGADETASLGLGADIGGSLGGSASATGEASATLSGTGSVRLSASASAAVSAEIALGIFGGYTIDAEAAVASWSEGDEPTRQVLNDVARISANTATMIEVGGLEYDLQLWPAYRAAILFGASVRAAAISATSETPSVFVMRILTQTALLPLAARIYGGAQAQQRARQIARLNDLRSPAWLDVGDYVIPSRTTAQRSPF